MTDTSLAKQYAKQWLRKAVGEPYVGKRLKLRRLSKVLDSLDLQPLHILDAGSEDATFVYWLADRYPNAQVTALDIDADAIGNCLRARPARYADRVHFRVGRFADLPPNSVDVITALDVLEHIPDDHSALEDLFSLLTFDGALLVHVPRDRWLTRSGLVHSIPDEDAWKVNPGHVRSGYSPENLAKLLAGAGFQVESVQPWLGRWGTLAHDIYARLETPIYLRLLTLPVTDVCAWADRRTGTPDGNAVFAYATKRGSAGYLKGK